MLAINKNLTTIPGMMFGIGVGYVYLENFGGFNAKQGKIWHKILRFLIGMLGAFLIMQVFKMPSKSNEYYNLLHFIKYAIIGIWCAFVAPMLFIFLKLAKKLQIENEK